MAFFPASLDNLVDRFASLPGIGRKSAQRLAFHILALPDAEAKAFAEAILDAKSSVHCCKICQNLTEGEICSVCASQSRDKATICVVSEPRDVASIEHGHEYNGTYHVLHGVLSPMGHVGPDDIRIKELLQRVADNDVEEVIMATNPDTEGEATAMYISRLLKPFGVKTTRLAYGIPVGSNLEFTDDATLNRAIEGRTEI
ncbi:MAG: recombination protein RecR [Oscillospiraceae bacterium]|nr:recombination protein RecR [Oscillospiraceae bacterium]